MVRHECASERQRFLWPFRMLPLLRAVLLLIQNVLIFLVIVILMLLGRDLSEAPAKKRMGLFSRATRRSGKT